MTMYNLLMNILEAAIRSPYVAVIVVFCVFIIGALAYILIMVLYWTVRDLWKVWQRSMGEHWRRGE